jgi:hypothetical protein
MHLFYDQDPNHTLDSVTLPLLGWILLGSTALPPWMHPPSHGGWQIMSNP